MAAKASKTHNKLQLQLMLQHEEAETPTKTGHDRGMFAGLRSRRRDSDEDLDEENLQSLGPDMSTKDSSRHFLASSSSVSPSSLQSLTTDSDSLPGEQTGNGQMSASRNVASSSPMSPHSEQPQSRNRSPILIKYNYYDYNGERQENHEIGATANLQANSSAQAAKVQRQLSPTFKQSLDQIVRSSQKYLQASQQSSSPSSPGHSPTGQQTNLNNNNNDPYTMTLLARRYKLSSYEHRCLRCAKTVYQMDKVGPLKDFTFYHQNCFKCRECGTKLTLKTYFNNQHSSTDQEVYCHRHCPKTPAGRLDNQSVGIRAALNAPKVFDPLVHQQDQLSPMVKSGNLQQQQLNQNQQPQVDSRALHIQHAVKQTKLQAIYKHSQVDKKISQFLNRRLEYLEPKQKMLEMRHREEEEQLFKVFEQKWLQEESSIRDQIRDEWQRELQKLLDKYKRQLSSSAAKNLNLANVNGNGSQPKQLDHELIMKMNQLKSEQQQRLHSTSIHQQQQLQLQHAQKTSQHQTPPSTRLDFHRLPTLSQEDSNAEQKMIELERMNLEKTMTIKLDRKKETLKRKLKEFERQATAELVEKQSREMITLISLKLEEFKEEQKGNQSLTTNSNVSSSRNSNQRKIGSDLEHFEAIESLANHLGASLQIPSKASSRQSPRGTPLMTNGTPNLTNGGDCASGKSRKFNGQQGHQQVLLAAPPLPEAPQLSKMELYNSDQPDEVFKDIDELAINVAKEDQRTFTDLVHHLTRHCLTDVEKVRAIFRWITVKNLNTMQFDSSVKPDTPLGLLRGIKQGSESYHVLFKRLCSYAGLHCVVIKGYSKSAGYQPGVRFESNRFRNSWNAVYVAGAWRFVQCNWGARHLVSVAVMQDKNSSNRSNDGSQVTTPNNGRSGQQLAGLPRAASKTPSDLTPVPPMANLGRRGLTSGAPLSTGPNGIPSPSSPTCSSSSSYSSGASSSCSSPANASQGLRHSNDHSKYHHNSHSVNSNSKSSSSADSLRYEYDDHYFLTDPDEFIYEFFPLAPEWQLLKSRPISLQEFEQLPFVRSLFFKYGLYFPQPDIRSVLYTNSSGATTIKIGMPTHMIPSLIFHYNLKYFDSDVEHHEGVSLKRFVMQSVESGGGSANGSSDTNLLSNIVSFRVHVPENGAYILDIFANSTTPNQYITGEPMKFKSVCKFKIIARQLNTVMVPLPDCASGEYGPMKATRLFGIIPLTHENGLISIQNDKRFLEIQFRMTRPLLDFMASLHKNGQDERQLSKLIKIFIDGDIVFIAIKLHEDGQYGLDIYTRDQQQLSTNKPSSHHDTKTNGCESQRATEPKKQLLTHCCKYLINVRASK